MSLHDAEVQFCPVLLEYIRNSGKKEQNTPRLASYHTYIRTHIHIYICMYVCMCIHVYLCNIYVGKNTTAVSCIKDNII